MEVGKVQHKTIREFLRCAELLLGEFRESKNGAFSGYERTLVKAYLDSLKSAVLQAESQDLVDQARQERARRQSPSDTQ
jgi:hypothetical protein